MNADQLFAVEKTEAPAKWAFLKTPIGWVKLTDQDGNSAVGALMKNGIIEGDLHGPWGMILTSQDCRATIEAAKALFA